jgi:plastocyanin
MKSTFIAGAAIALVSFCVASRADAIHFYRGPAGGCTPASGQLTDDPVDGAGKLIRGPIVTTIRMGHNYYHEAPSSPTEGIQPERVTTIKVGQAIRWTWNSAHCHSVQSDDGKTFKSGYHYPTTPPESPQVAPGAFDYPINDETPTLEYVHTFQKAGTFDYFCVHHDAIGMNGQIVVEP